MLHVTPHGVPIPALGLGTFRLNGAVAERMVGHALAVGYRHIDTAQMYGNETEVGAAIRRSLSVAASAASVFASSSDVSVTSALTGATP